MMEGISPRGPTAPVGAKEICGVGGVGDGGVAQLMLPALKSLIVTFDCKKVQIGSLKGTPFEPVTLSIDGVKILMECEDKSIQLQIPLKDIHKCFVCYDNKL